MAIIDTALRVLDGATGPRPEARKLTADEYDAVKALAGALRYWRENFAQVALTVPEFDRVVENQDRKNNPQPGSGMKYGNYGRALQ